MGVVFFLNLFNIYLDELSLLLNFYYYLFIKFTI
jgi:hypothetical protein